MPAPSTERDTEAAASARAKRRFWWALTLAAVLLLLALTPPLLNVSRLQRRIAASMSASLGRPVHLDRVKLHLLPVPGFTLENLVVSEDPGFGFEPVIRANTVEVRLRPSSLWRRHVEFSTIRFIEPSLNLVRNAQGKWNLQSLLLHAASVNTAPTAQSKAGPEPRFPYIEATGARVNLKLGNEKTPFSLTDADFALWLPTPAQWRVRVEARPARTDRNITDPGTVRLEASLQRAASMADVPIDLRASWEGAPLGEASKLLSGGDANWRGSLTGELTLQGRLGAAKLATKLHFENLRRADFIPAKLLDVQLECSGVLETMTAIVHTPACALAQANVTAVADSVDLTRTGTAGLAGVTGLRIGTPGLQADWLMDVARLFSERIPVQSVTIPTLRGSAEAVAGPSNLPSLWQGSFSGDAVPAAAANTVPLAPFPWEMTAVRGQWMLAPVNVLPSPASLLLSATADDHALTLHWSGSATPAEALALRALLPPLTDGLAEAAPGLFDGSATQPLKLDLSCSRLWAGPQICFSTPPEVARRPAHRR